MIQIFIFALLAVFKICFANLLELGSDRLVMQIGHGNIEFGLLKNVAPQTTAHILKLFRMGAYNSNRVQRIEKGFIIQISDIKTGRSAKLDEKQMTECMKPVPLEVDPSVHHVKGVLSMARGRALDSGGSSFSIVLGDAPQLDGNYTIFGFVTKGWDVLESLQSLTLTQDGLVNVPKYRTEIRSTYVYSLNTGFNQGRDEAQYGYQYQQKCPACMCVIGYVGLVGWLLLISWLTFAYYNEIRSSFKFRKQKKVAQI